jgi:hypothetical protein
MRQDEKEERWAIQDRWAGHFLQYHPAEYETMWEKWRIVGVNVEKAHDRLHHGRGIR